MKALKPRALLIRDVLPVNVNPSLTLQPPPRLQTTDTQRGHYVTISNRGRGGSSVCVNALVAAARRVIFNCPSSLEELFYAALLKGEERLDTAALPRCARTKCLPARDNTQPAAEAPYGQTCSVLGNHQRNPRSHLCIAGCCQAEHGYTDLPPRFPRQNFSVWIHILSGWIDQSNSASEATLPCRGFIKLAEKAQDVSWLD